MTENLATTMFAATIGNGQPNHQGPKANGTSKETTPLNDTRITADHSESQHVKHESFEGVLQKKIKEEANPKAENKDKPKHTQAKPEHPQAENAGHANGIVNTNNHEHATVTKESITIYVPAAAQGKTKSTDQPVESEKAVSVPKITNLVLPEQAKAENNPKTETNEGSPVHKGQIPEQNEASKEPAVEQTLEPKKASNDAKQPEKAQKTQENQPQQPLKRTFVKEFADAQKSQEMTPKAPEKASDDQIKPEKTLETPVKNAGQTKPAESKIDIPAPAEQKVPQKVAPVAAQKVEQVADQKVAQNTELKPSETVSPEKQAEVRQDAPNSPFSQAGKDTTEPAATNTNTQPDPAVKLVEPTALPKDAAQPAKQRSDNGAFEQILTSANHIAPMSDRAAQVSAQAAARAAQTPLPPETAQSIRDQITESITTSVNKGENEITVRLDPPELGKVSIKLIENGNEITGTMEVSKAQTRYEIEHALPQLLKSLQESGLQVKKIEVTLTPEQPHHEGSKDNGLHNGWANQSWREGSTNSGSNYSSGYDTPYTDSDPQYTPDASQPILAGADSSIDMLV